MANTVTGRFNVIAELAYVAGQLGSLQPKLSFNKPLAFGTSDWQINKAYIQERSVVSGVPDVLNLSDGTLKDFANVSLVFTKVLIMVLFNEDGTNDLTMGANGTNPFEGWVSAGGTVPIPFGSCFSQSKHSGFAVGAGASDRLKIVASAGTITYAIALLGQ